jgi:hypothetical protein
MLAGSCSEFSVMFEMWCERSNIKIDEHKTQAIYFSHTLWPPEAHLPLNGRNLPFVNHVKYLCVFFDKNITWRLHIEMIETKAFRTFFRIYSLFKSERLIANIKLITSISVITYASPAWKLAADIS